MMLGAAKTDEISAWLSEDGGSVMLCAWCKDQPFVSQLLKLPAKIAPRFFADNEWCAVAPTLAWYSADGQRVASPPVGRP